NGDAGEKENERDQFQSVLRISSLTAKDAKDAKVTKAKNKNQNLTWMGLNTVVFSLLRVRSVRVHFFAQGHQRTSVSISVISGKVLVFILDSFASLCVLCGKCCLVVAPLHRVLSGKNGFASVSGVLP